MAHVAVLARHPHLAAPEELVDPARMLADPGTRGACGSRPPGRQLAPQDRQRSQADPAADEDRPGGLGVELARVRERTAKRPRHPQSLPLPKRGEPLGARADVLDQEVEPDAAVRDSASATEKARGRYGRPERRSPALGGGEHVELPGSRLGAGGVERGEDPVAARLAVVRRPRTRRRGARGAIRRARQTAGLLSGSSGRRL